MRRAAAFSGWCALLAASLWVLHGVGGTDLSIPIAPGRWVAWVEEVGPASAVVAIVRFLGLLVGWYLAAVTLVGALASRLGVRRVHANVARVTPRFLVVLVAGARGVTISAAGLGLALTPLVPAIRGDHPAPDRSLASTASLVRTVGPSTATLELQEPPVVHQPSLPVDFGSLRVPHRPTPSDQVDLDPTVVSTWTVSSGDHLWSIADETLEERLGHRPTESEIATYWLLLIDSNRDTLVSPNNPDLIYPGQVFVLP